MLKSVHSFKSQRPPFFFFFMPKPTTLNLSAEGQKLQTAGERKRCGGGVVRGGGGVGVVISPCQPLAGAQKITGHSPRLQNTS